MVAVDKNLGRKGNVDTTEANLNLEAVFQLEIF